MPDAGSLDRRITIARKTELQDATGQLIESWAVWRQAWMGKRDITATERLRANQELATETTVWRSHYIEGLNEQDRLVDGAKTYDIIGIAEIGRRSGYEITATALLGAEPLTLVEAVVANQFPNPLPGSLMLAGQAPDVSHLILIDRTAGTNIGTLTASGGLAAAFDGVTNQASGSCASLGGATDAYVGKTLASAKTFGRGIIYGSNDQGFWSTTPTVTLTMYGKSGAAPANSADGTTLGTASFTDTANESAGRQIESTNFGTTWDHIWVRVQQNGAGATCRVAELVLYEWGT